MREVYLLRILQDNKQSLGSLSVTGDEEVYVYKTLELGWKGNANGVSCIPSGRYLCKWTYSPSFKKFTYEVTGVTGRLGIRIHSANFYTQLRGCIALGSALKDINADLKLDTIHSGDSIEKFNLYMNKEDFMLNIV